MATRKEQAEQTRRKILDATQFIIREEGIHALSSLKIVQKAGISKGSFFHHFPQIEDLYLYMLEELFESLDEEISPEKFDNLEAFLQGCTHFTISMLEESPESISSIFFFLSQSKQKKNYQIKLNAYMEKTFAQWTKNMDHFFPEHFSELQKDNIVRLLDMYFCGLSFHYLILHDKERYLQITNKFIKLISQELNPEKP